MKLPILSRLEQLEEEAFFLEDEKIFKKKRFIGGDCSYEEVHNLVLKQCLLEKIVMQKSRLERFEASNVIFDRCDFSNLEWIGGSFHQVEFRQCKLIGTNFADSFLRDCKFVDCIANLSSFSSTNLKFVNFERCKLNDGDFFNVKWKNLNLIDSELNRSNWMKTQMKDLNLSKSYFDQIALTIEDIPGMKVNTGQALVISTGLGLKIID